LKAPFFLTPNILPSLDQKPVAGYRPMPPSSVIWVLTLVVLWAANAVLVKIVVRDIPPFWAAALRFSMALVIVGVYARMKRVDLKVSFPDLSRIAFLGVLSYLQIFLFNYGSQFTTGGRISLFIFSYPLMVPFLAHYIVKGEGLAARNVTGSLISFVGLFIVVSENFLNPTHQNTLKGDIMQIASCLTLALLIVCNKRLIARIHAIKILFWQIATSLILYYLSGFCFEHLDLSRVRPDALLCLLFQGLVVGGFCFISWQVLLARYASFQLSVYFFLTPFFGIIIGWLVFNETVTLLLALGGLLVCSGIYIVNSQKTAS
jgi:drug/metabolite transporter (DMT)-like permease